ncbi:FAD-binding domain-containing protein [Aspergillus affinis]|uniref:FAD-binding domain-containing protein n=1 Tax=Aspergillus affinis TaxID=1070780 RepID=UPI0022FE5D12|nr:FAD-binding domain-containing protein [Aspergillus affinis]KAI9045945.1 FAD-binding domain-containing protein [Aspergillus affinis]
MDDNRIIVFAIDFGLTYTGAAFICPSSSRRPDEVVTFNKWPSHNGTKHAQKAPSAIAYPAHNPNELWALSTGPWERAGGALWMPENKTPIAIAADFLREVYRCIARALKDHVAKVTRGKCDGIPVELWFTVPTTWSEVAKERTRQVALQAGFDTGLGGYPAQVLLVDEPLAAMTDIIAQASPRTYTLWAGVAVFVCDCSGGTTDVVSYHIDEVDPYSYSEISEICGATTVQRALYDLMIERFGDAFLDVPLALRALMSPFMAAFEERLTKFNGFNTSGVRLPLPMNSQGLNQKWFDFLGGDVLLSADDLRNLFNPALGTICNLLSRQMAAAYNHPERVQINQKIFLVGGFSLSPYVFQTICNRFAVNGATIVYRPNDAQLFTVRGAAIWGSGVLRPATNISHCHFGVEASMTMNNFYSADFHLRISLSGGRPATNDITWLVSKVRGSTTYDPDDFEHCPIFLVHKDGDFPIKSLNVYCSVSGSSRPRRCATDDASYVRLVEFRLGVDTTPHREVHNCHFYLVECNVRVTLGENSGFVNFEVWAQNQDSLLTSYTIHSFSSTVIFYTHPTCLFSCQAMASNPSGSRALVLHSLIYMLIFVILAPLATANICSDLETQGLTIQKDHTPDFDHILKDYWSGICADLRPRCIITPANAHEMSEVVKKLHHADDLFAVKSGGHMASPGFASVRDGLLVSTKKLNQVVYNPNDKTAVVGPGLTWEDAQKALRGTGRALVGGRLGGVGVGGLMLGGGWSFLSTQYGWAANNVVNYEVVLANGTIVNANKKENADLFGVLGGGGNNFGIITSYKLQTQPLDHKVWGGEFIYMNNTHADHIMQAIRDFAEYYPDPKAGIIATTQYTPTLQSWIIFTFYDGPQPPKGVFDNFTALHPKEVTKAWDSYDELLKANDIHILKDRRYTTFSETLPVPNAACGPKVMKKLQSHWFNTTATILNVPDMIGALSIQPLPRKMSQIAKEKGGDLYHFPTDQDYFVINVDYSYFNSSFDEKIWTANQKIIDGYEDLIDDLIDEEVLPDVPRPLFLNEIDGQQDYWGRLDPKTTEWARKVREKYDPEMFFQTRTSGGFKLG